MDPRDRADAILARARARGAYVVTPESAISPMDAAATLQIPRAVVAAIDETDPEITLVFPPGAFQDPAPPQHHPTYPTPEPPAIAQEAATQSVAAPGRPPRRPHPPDRDRIEGSIPPPPPPQQHQNHHQPPRPSLSQRLDGDH
ncbi:hypothetical protein [Actinokineospora inagensis]|uniref:hypothetical protein n=1 Tax=Actinokineospora inagensis TaxID=103730 RepID=UPI0003FC7D0C|nr:hypothetical protein [Actinokineospora inagensis]